MTPTARDAWHTPRLTSLRVNLDTANGEGSGADQESFSIVT